MTNLDLNNKYRVILTDVLPYEIPLMFDNDLFYQNLNDERKNEIFKKQFNNITSHRRERWYIPFNYRVRRYGGDHSRTLSIIHPLNQLDVSEFYEKYADYMLYLCNRSPFSIRYISSVSKCIFNEKNKNTNSNNYIDQERNLNSEDDGGLEVESDLDDEYVQIHEKYASFFTYEKYDRLYKFYDGISLVRLEQKYKYCMKLDLSRCFYHIYTHSVAWAVKGKEYAKDNQKSDSLECEFDYLMQHCNYNETNGIVVGPEFSRIFAEIILQKIDLDILDELRKNDIILGKDYDVLRYVDDYFVFANDEIKFDIIKKVCEKKCEPYKLYINEKKVQIIKRPFATNISSAKNEVKELIKDVKEKYFCINDDGTYKRRFADSSWGLSDFAHKYSSITHQNNVNYSETNRYALSLIKKILKTEVKRNVQPSEGQVLSFIEISFYLFSLDMNVSGSVQMSRIIDIIVDWTDKISEKNVKQNIMDRLYREAKRCFDVYASTSKNDQTNIEILNLLLVLYKKTKFDINGELIKSIFNLQIENGVKKGFERLDYFQICTILYVLENKDMAVLSSLIEEIKRKFKEKETPLLYSELALLYFDVLTCPYIDIDSKIEIYAIAQKKENTPRKRAENKSNVGEVANVKRWFFDWDKNKNLSAIIRKKEYIPAYQ